MRKSNTQPISEVIEACLKSLHVDKKLKEYRAVKSWEDVIGKTVAKATTKIYIDKKILYIHVNSSVIRNEIMMIKEGIIKRMNDICGEKIIEKIVVR